MAASACRFDGAAPTSAFVSGRKPGPGPHAALSEHQWVRAGDSRVEGRLRRDMPCVWPIRVQQSVPVHLHMDNVHAVHVCNCMRMCMCMCMPSDIHPCPCLHAHVSMPMSPCPCRHVHVSMPMSPCPCRRLHLSMPMSQVLCPHVCDTCPCARVTCIAAPGIPMARMRGAVHVHVSVHHRPVQCDSACNRQFNSQDGLAAAVCI